MNSEHVTLNVTISSRYDLEGLNWSLNGTALVQYHVKPDRLAVVAVATQRLYTTYSQQ